MHDDLGCVPTTSGLYDEIPGRVGDSPAFGAGPHLDDAVGSAGPTGRGEANLLNRSGFAIAEGLRRGSTRPTRRWMPPGASSRPTARIACATSRGGRTSP